MGKEIPDLLRSLLFSVFYSLFEDVVPLLPPPSGGKNKVCRNVVFLGER